MSVFITCSACAQTFETIVCSPIGSSPTGATRLLQFVIRLCAFVNVIDWFIDLSIERSIGWFTYLLIDWLIYWLVDRSIDWLTCWLVGWLLDWFIHSFIHTVKIIKLFQMSRQISLIKNLTACDWWQRYRLEGPVPSNWAFFACRSHFSRFKFLKPGFISIYEQDKHDNLFIVKHNVLSVDTTIVLI